MQPAVKTAALRLVRFLNKYLHFLSSDSDAERNLSGGHNSIAKPHSDFRLVYVFYFFRALPSLGAGAQAPQFCPGPQLSLGPRFSHAPSLLLSYHGNPETDKVVPYNLIFIVNWTLCNII